MGNPLTPGPSPASRARGDLLPSPRGGGAGGEGDDFPISARIVEFVRLARERHFRAGIDESADALRVAGIVQPTERSEFKSGLRTLLCSSAGDWARFDEFFDAYWRSPQ